MTCWYSYVLVQKKTMTLNIMAAEHGDCLSAINQLLTSFHVVRVNPNAAMIQQDRQIMPQTYPQKVLGFKGLALYQQIRLGYSFGTEVSQYIYIYIFIYYIILYYIILHNNNTLFETTCSHQGTCKAQRPISSHFEGLDTAGIQPPSYGKQSMYVTLDPFQ